MIIEFTKEILEELKRQITRSLKETLHTMFGLEVTLSTSPPDAKNDQGYKSYFELFNAHMVTGLAITIPFDIAEKIAKTFVADPQACPISIMQDATNEVANVVVHAVRSYFINTHGLSFDINIPNSSGNNRRTSNMDTINLYFLIKATDPIDVAFSYPKASA